MRNFLRQYSENESDVDKLTLHFEAVGGNQSISHLEKPRTAFVFYSMFMQKKIIADHPHLTSEGRDPFFRHQFQMHHLIF